MSHRIRSATLTILVLGVAAAPASASGLNAYRLEATAHNLRVLAAAGFDLTEGRDLRRGTIEVVATSGQLAAAKLHGAQVTNYDEKRRASTLAPTDGATDAAYTVWTKFDAVPADGKEQYTEFYDRILADFPAITASRVTGTTYGLREITAIQVTKGATGSDIPGRPAVLYNSLQHAREWLAGETCRRTLEYFTSNYGKTTSAGLEVTRLVDNTELWFVCVNNPDGYEFTFTPGHRLWRKNLADNNGDFVIDSNHDGVDPNRNFSSHWGRDNEGSSPNPASETYRGPMPASEPETTAMESLFAEIHPVFQKNDHTAAQLLLYPQGFQQDTLSADDEIFRALAGDPFKPAIEGFLPELSAGLYITNGDFTDWAYSIQGTLSYTPEGTAAEDPNVSGFEYADSPLQVSQEFHRHLAFILDLANSATHPEEPSSHLGNTAKPITVDAFAVSYGDPQPVAAVVQRKLGDAFLKFRINGGGVQTVTTAGYAGGERYYNDPGVFYRRVRGFVKGTSPGDSVEAWFAAGAKESEHFTYSAQVESANSVLLLANEDWSGKQPNAVPFSGPQYIDIYKAALDAAGVHYDVYDIDTQGRRAADALGVLSHYSHVVWYTGDDYVTREPDAPGGSGMSKLARDTQNEVRDFLNDGGKLFYTGKNAGREFAEGFLVNPFQVEEHTYCQNANPSCVISQDDFLQYYLGAYTYVVGGGHDGTDPFPVEGTAGAFDPLSLTFNGADSAQNGDTAATLLVTSSVLDPVTYPLFGDSAAAGTWQRPYAAPFAPHEGSYFLSAGATNAAYKRLLKPFTVPAGGGKVKFFTSFDLESDYDYMFVEIHTVSQDDWTTLADENGDTSDDTGLACPSTGAGSNWQSLHPFLAHYQTKSGTGDSCTSTGSSGSWNAATSNSGGWQEWSLPIPAAYHGAAVEISVTVASDPATLGLGAWVDELKVVDSADAPINSADPSFEAGIDGWTTPGPPPPPGQGQSDATGWVRATSAPFVETPIVTTTDTVFTGFGFEAITGADNRRDFMIAVFGKLGAPSKPAFNAPDPIVTGGGSGGGGAAGGGVTPITTVPGPNIKRLKRIIVSPQSLSFALRRGVLMQVSCKFGCRVRLDLTASASERRRLHLPSRLGRVTVTLTRTGKRILRVSFSQTARKRLRRARSLQLVINATQLDITPALRARATARLSRR